jgi:hypothetical protein
MHPGSTTPSKTVERHSLKNTLESIYKESKAINTGGGDAKQAGKPSFQSTHLLGEKDLDFQPDLGAGGIANDQKSNALYNWNNGNTLLPNFNGKNTLPVVKYAPSGRL